METLVEENYNNESSYYRKRTLKVLEKWGVIGDINEFNPKDASHSYAKLHVKNKMMKWVVISSILFLLIFLGFMIGSVVIGNEITKDFKLKNDFLVPRYSKTSVITPLKTEEAFFSANLKLTTPLSVINGIKKLKVQTVQIDGTPLFFQFEVVSFYYSYGRNLTLYGHTHMANVMPDETVEVIPISIVNGVKRYDISKRDVSSNTTATTTSSMTADGTEILPIITCLDLQSLLPNGTYQLLSDLNCTFDAPLSTFGGKIFGNAHMINVNMDNSGYPVGLFVKVTNGAKFKNFMINGTFTGQGLCAVFAVEINSGAIMNTISIYANINCDQDPNNNDAYVFASTFAALLTNPDNITNPVTWTNCVAEGSINLQTNNPNNSIQTSFYSFAYPQNFNTSLNGTVAATYLLNVGEGYNIAKFGYKSNIAMNFSSMTPETRMVSRTIDGIFPDNCIEVWCSGNSTAIKIQVNQCVAWWYTYHYENQCCCDGYVNSFDCIEYYCPNYPVTKMCMYCPICTKKRDYQVINGQNVEIFTPDTVPIIYARDISLDGSQELDCSF